MDLADSMSKLVRLLVGLADAVVVGGALVSVLAAWALQYSLRKAGFFQGSFLDLLTWGGNRHLRAAARRWVGQGQAGTLGLFLWRFLQVVEAVVVFFLLVFLFTRLTGSP